MVSLFRTLNFACGKGESDTHGVVVVELLLRPIQEAHSRILLLGLGLKDGVIEDGVDVVGFQVQVGEVGQGSVEGPGEKLEIWGLDCWVGW